ncbi:MAG: hypothetical protein MK005_02395 [Alcanivorax sp.]|nr:hypothetical protein [Alcanivorax sp.]
MTLKYVSLIQDGVLRTGDSPERTFSYHDEADLVHLVKRMVEQEYAFADAPAGWPPAAVLQDLQDRGDLNFSFTAVIWSGPGQYRTYRVEP